MAGIMGPPRDEGLLNITIYCGSWLSEDEGAFFLRRISTVVFLANYPNAVIFRLL